MIRESAAFECVKLVTPALNYPEAFPTIWRGHYRINRLRRQRSINQFTNRPNMIRDALRHRWRGADRFVHAAQTVVRDEYMRRVTQLGDTNDTKQGPRNIPATRGWRSTRGVGGAAIPNKDGNHQMRDRMIVLTAAGALALATIWFASPYATVTFNVAQTEVLAVDFFHLTENTQTASQQRLARH